MVPDDVFIVDIGGQALDIFPHSAESAQMMVIMQSSVHSHVHSLLSIHSKKEQQKQNSPNGTYSARGPVPLLPLSNVVYHIGEGWYPLLRVGLLRRPSHLRMQKHFEM